MTTEATNTQTAPATDKKPVAKYAPQTVERNSVKGSFVSDFIKRGEEKGTEYPAMMVTKDNLDTVIAWIDPAIVAKKLGAFLRTMAQGWWGEAVEQATDAESKKLDVDKAYTIFQQLASEFSARGESIPELKAQIDELVAQIDEVDVDADDYADQVKALATEIKKLKIDIESKKRKPREAKTEAVAA